MSQAKRRLEQRHTPLREIRRVEREQRLPQQERLERQPRRKEGESGWWRAAGR